ncbi:RNA-directed DNA polymerase, eukaryota [Tanacetum coccineum]
MLLAMETAIALGIYLAYFPYEEGFQRCALNGQLHDIKKKEAADSFQKSKVRWAIEGDENSNDPRAVKEVFHNHFASRFKKPTFPRLKINFPFPNRLSQDQAIYLERNVSRNEIRVAVWNYGDNKSLGPGPDGYTFEFFKKYWGFIGFDFCEAVDHFFAKGAFSKGCNSSFIALIPKSAFVSERQILDGPFIINELLHWCKRKYKKAMFFKVDFAKPYDSASILLNGSPTNEFDFHCGLKQGDLLALLLFILVMESLHLSFSRVVEAGLFKGIRLNSSLSLYDLFYAGDALIIGVGIPRSDIETAASSIGCSIMDNQFRYLGVMVGGNMSHHKAWEDVVLKLRSRLSKWKVKTLSIGGRLTLLKSVRGASPLYNMSIFKAPKGVLKEMESIRNNFFIGADPSDKKITWIAWDKVLASKIKGGLGVSSFFALNRALISQMGMEKGDSNLHDTFPRMFALEADKQSTVAAKIAQVDGSFRRPVRSGDGRFRVKDIRNLIDDLILPSWSEPTRWVKFIPIKINIFVWRARRDCLPTRTNLIRRGVYMDSIACPICGSYEEDIHHILFECDLAQVVLPRIYRWWDLDWQIWSSFANRNAWFSTIKLASNIKSLLEGQFRRHGSLSSTALSLSMDDDIETFKVNQQQEFAPFVVSPLLKQFHVYKNPSIGKSFGIVVPGYDPRIVYAFGVCPVTSDPTVVMVLCANNMPWQVEVFTLSSGGLECDSKWFIYWGACEMTSANNGISIINHMVVLFDLITKDFKVVDLPDSLTNELNGTRHDSSFRKLFTIGSPICKILRFRNNGEPIFRSEKVLGSFTTLDVYDPSSQQIKNLDLGISGLQSSFFMGSYKESLLLLDYSDLHIYSNDS